MFYFREVRRGEICVLELMKYGVWCVRVRVNEIEDEIWKVIR